MIASYKIKSHHICSSPNKKLTENQTSKSFFMFNNFYSKLCFDSHLNPNLMSSGTSDLVSILTFFMFKCGLRLSMHLFLARQQVFLWPILYCLLVSITFRTTHSFLKYLILHQFFQKKVQQLLHLLTFDIVLLARSAEVVIMVGEILVRSFDLMEPPAGYSILLGFSTLLSLLENLTKQSFIQLTQFSLLLYQRYFLIAFFCGLFLLFPMFESSIKTRWRSFCNCRNRVKLLL